MISRSNIYNITGLSLNRHRKVSHILLVWYIFAPGSHDEEEIIAERYHRLFFCVCRNFSPTEIASRKRGGEEVFRAILIGFLLEMKKIHDVEVEIK